MIQRARLEVMMENWILFLIFVGGGCLIGLIFRWLNIAPLDRENESGVKECLDKQARKRSGIVKASSRWSVLTIPYKSINIEVSVNEGMENPLEDYTYATFRTKVFTDKKFGIYYWKEFFLRPLGIGTRLEILDEKLGETYTVSGNDASFIEGVLTPEIRAKLLEFKESFLRVQFGRPRGSSLLSREQGWLTVFAYGIGTVDQPYDRVIETAILFHERLETLDRGC